jgi:molecular chaperone DnaJ
MDPVEVLKLKPGNTLNDAKRHYRLLSLKYHPDKNPGDPSAADKFRIITDSYDIIKRNPGLLKPKKTGGKRKSYSGYIITEICADISDVYLAKEKKVTILRKRLCESCGGSGSSLGSSGVCDLCKGKKKVKNRVSSIMGIKSDVCPSCNGTGVKEAPKCPDCSGYGFFEEKASLSFTITKDQLEKKLVVLKSVGSEFKKGYMGDVHVNLKEVYNSRLVIEGGDYRLCYEISPAQYAIGDTVYVNIFGKKVKLVIPRRSEEGIIRDKREDGITREIIVDLRIGEKTITKEVESLYRKIIEAEKTT